MAEDGHRRDERTEGPVALLLARHRRSGRRPCAALRCAIGALGCLLALPFSAGCSGSPPLRPEVHDAPLPEGRETFDAASASDEGGRDERMPDAGSDALRRRDVTVECGPSEDARTDGLVDLVEAAVDCRVSNDAGSDAMLDARADGRVDGEPTDALQAGDGEADEGKDARPDRLDGTCSDGGTRDSGGADAAAACDGPCCRDGVLLGLGTTCEPEADVDYGCPQGTDCGSVVAFRVRGRLCSGTSPACDGDLGPWSDWQPLATCDETASCVEGQRACVPSTACPCPEDMVHVPAGSFVMGAPPGQGYLDTEYPEHEVTHPAYCIDRYEVTAAKYAEFMNARDSAGAIPGLCGNNVCLGEDESPPTVVYTAPGWEVATSCQNDSNTPASETCAQHPVVDVTWAGAFAYCAWYGRRLPSEAEWERAARGTDGRRYPWGNEAPSRTPGECPENADEEDACADGYERTASVGSFAEDRSPAGCYDMMGNVNERVADDWHQNYLGGPSDGSAWLDYTDRPPVGGLVVVRGGGYDSPYAPIWSRGADTRTVGTGWTGFRCAR